MEAYLIKMNCMQSQILMIHGYHLKGKSLMLINYRAHMIGVDIFDKNN